MNGSILTFFFISITIYKAPLLSDNLLGLDMSAAWMVHRISEPRRSTTIYNRLILFFPSKKT
jgi:hypothetical protein